MHASIVIATTALAIVMTSACIRSSDDGPKIVSPAASPSSTATPVVSVSPTAPRQATSTATSVSASSTPMAGPTVWSQERLQSSPAANPTPTPTASATLALVSYPPACDGVDDDRLCVTTSDDNSVPEGCSLTDVHELFTRLAGAFNEGEAESFRNFFPQESAEGDSSSVAELHWFTVGGWDEVEFEAIYNPDEIADFVLRRHQQGEQWEFRQVIIPQVAHRYVASMQFRLVRGATDLAERLVQGKGAINCNRGMIFLWSIGNG